MRVMLAEIYREILEANRLAVEKRSVQMLCRRLVRW